MAEANAKKSRLRSPAYPYLDLKQAVEKAELFNNTEGFHHVPALVATKELGYEQGSSRGWRAVASLISFGLLEDGGTKEHREVWLTELGKEIVAYGNKDSDEAKSAIRTAALKPAIHSELWQLWSASGQQLPSDDTMKRHLLKEKAFNPLAVDAFIQEFRDTLTYAGLIKDGRISSTENAPENKKKAIEGSGARSTGGRRMNTEGVQLEDNTIPLVGGATAILSAPRPLSKKNYELIKNWLVLMEDSLTSDVNTSQSKDAEEPEKE